jgi:hypothetical protein
LCDTVSFFILKPWQIALHFIGAIASGIMFFFWSRLNDVEKKRVWRLYGWFAGLTCAGSIFGIVAECAGIKYAQTMVELVSSRNLAEEYYWQAELSKWATVVLVPDSFEVLFISVPLLMVLDRLIHVAFSTSGGLGPRFLLAERVATGIVVVLHVIAICFCGLSAFYISKRTSISRDIVAALSANDTTTSRARIDDLNNVKSISYDSQIVTVFCESMSLLFVVAMFVVVFVVCFRRIQQIRQQAILSSISRQQPACATSSAKSDSVTAVDIDTSSSMDRVSHHTAHLISNMNDVERQIGITVVIVFIMLLWLAAFFLLDGISTIFENATCDTNGSYCSHCQNSYSLIQDWLSMSPEFSVISQYVPGQLAVTVALWGMTSKRTLQAIRSQRQSSSATL